MESLGFQYYVCQKTYYIDGHEKPEVVAYRKKYVANYIDDEIRCFRWVQLSEDEVAKMEQTNADFVRDSGYKYIDNETGLTMYEFHVDDLQNSHEKNQKHSVW